MEIYNRIKKDLGIMLVIYVVVIFSFELFEYGYDSTDGRDRSGMSLHVDAMTGCHYLGGKGGGLTPRLRNTGEHICNGL